MVIANIDRGIYFANQAAERMFGFEPSELIGAAVLKLHSNSSVNSAGEVSEATFGGSWTGEIVCVRKNGVEFAARLSPALMTEDQGHPLAMGGIVTDLIFEDGR